ncbi:mechanosensitive ion channel family protein [Chitinolyticbacter meiyuanensis]|uniref:mechanosensitive ion channel family protein n=1 Tax=Chitinolyticbacter meiyuanensis TaxID=682798 RepID=UPI0011E604F8|nr:mechanosensitive ion channel family protein [Chitinolyticbacter meiyuanensis]
MKKALTLLLFTLSCWLTLAQAEESAPTPAPAQPATVVVLNREVATLRVSIFGYSPAQRVRAAEQRIDQMLNSASPGKLHARIDAQGAVIEHDNTMLFTILPQDVDKLAGDTVQAAAKRAELALIAAIADAQAFRKPADYAWAAARAVLATMVAGFAFLLLAKGWRWWRQRALVLLLGASRKFAAGPFTVTPGIVQQTLHWLGIVLMWPVMLLLSYTWISFVLGQFPHTRIWSEQLDRRVIDFLGDMMASVLDALPGLAIAVFIVLLTRWITRSINFTFRRIESGQLQIDWFDADTASTTRRLLVCLSWLIALAMVYPYLPGANTEAFKGLSVMVGLMVSLGASSVVGQFASGLILIYSRSLKVGEYVKIADQEGTVAEIGLFATKVHTNLREEISIPNSVLVNQSVQNYSRLATGGGVIVSVVMTIGYDTPWRQVEAMMLEGAKRTTGILPMPAPVVFQTALADFYVEYSLRVALSEPRRRLQILNELHGHLQDVFNEYGVQIMSPNYEADPDHPKLVKPDDFYPAPAQKPAGQNQA